MKRLAASVLVAVSVLASQAVRAQAPAADGCAKFIDAIEPDCQLLNKKLQQLQVLSKTPEDKAKNVADIAALQKDIAALQAKPYAGVCVSFGTGDLKIPRTCNFLASLLPSDLAPPPSPAAKDADDQRKQAAAEKAAVARQADRQTSTNKSGSAAQTEPVESIQPITLAGGAVTLSGTHSGTQGVGTITVNPLALAAPGDVVAGRMMDLSVSAPFDLSGSNAQDHRYVSARLRVNATAPFSAADLKTAVQEWMAAEGQYADKLEDVLATAPDVGGCVASILKTQKVTQAACGKDLGAEASALARDKALAKIKEKQRDAEAYYVGIDARFDSGDPTGPEVVGDKGTHILGGIAAGVRVNPQDRWSFELRGRAAGDYFKSRDDAAGPSPKPVYSFDWGAAMILSGHAQEDDKQRMAFGVGVEGRQAKSSAEADLAPTNYANLNLMAVVPAASGGDIGLAFTIPIADSKIPHGAMVVLSTDLGLLDHSPK